MVELLPDMPVRQAGEVLRKSGFDGVPVVDEARTLLGMFTQDRLVRVFPAEKSKNLRVAEVMVTGTFSLRESMSLDELQDVKEIYRQNLIPVVNDANQLQGVVTQTDLKMAAEFRTLAAELESVRNLRSTLESVLENLFEGVVVVDKDGVIKMINRAYCRFLGYDNARELTGRHVTTVIPNTRLHLVVKAGEVECEDIQRIGEHNVVVTRIPIVKDGQVVGAMGKVLFKDLNDVKLLYGKLNKLRFEVEYYREELRKAQGGRYNIDHIIGNSDKITNLKKVVTKVASGNSTVLILGESGTGKELFAKAVHNASLRAGGPFIKVNCAAIPENLLESELFGYEDGAFTGARKGGKAGKFELANGGTILLDEIGDMSAIMQAKLLRVLQEREAERVGGIKPYKLDMRVIAATNCDLDEMIRQGKFRQDLYYRLNIITLNIPPLRERREDIPLLCRRLLAKLRAQLNNWVEDIAPQVLEVFMQYEWPGNVRELENVLERAVNWATDDTIIQVEHLPPLFNKRLKKDFTKNQPEGNKSMPALFDIKDNAEKQAICAALEACGGNKSKAAQMLGINRSGFYQKLHKYSIR
jgi:PAS domain S-box-containing protein